MDLHNLYLHLQGVDLVLLDLHFEDILGHKDYHHTLGFELFHLVAVEEKLVNKLGRLDLVALRVIKFSGMILVAPRVIKFKKTYGG